MKRFSVAMLALVVAAGALALLSGGRPASAHCEIPCGIFDDGARFQSLLEIQTTVAKAMDQVSTLGGAEKVSPQDWNQLARWVAVKEEHATKAMDLVAQYFMAQRIKPGAAGDEAAGKRYVDLLTKAHAVMIAAMKCKQSVDAATANAFKDAITAFRTSYESK